ncbi:hypothetical protein [Psychromonas ossibalaenae]|uniref:hypothetical protein n=1 Tax=Psychromonas ossibalaenae TaxID=444922 RepID=UPI00035F4D72|nr:hypothetical protein [Psychromonas ossibalaenae]
MNKQALTENHKPIASVFNSVVKGVQDTLNTSRLQSAVDIELNFNQVTISKKGIPLFTKKKEQTEMSIKLATRVIPSSK